MACFHTIFLLFFIQSQQKYLSSIKQFMEGTVLLRRVLSCNEVAKIIHVFRGRFHRFNKVKWGSRKYANALERLRKEWRHQYDCSFIQNGVSYLKYLPLIIEVEGLECATALSMIFRSGNSRPINKRVNYYSPTSMTQ